MESRRLKLSYGAKRAGSRSSNSKLEIDQSWLKLRLFLHTCQSVYAGKQQTTTVLAHNG